MKKEERNAVLVLVVAFFLGLLCTGGCAAQRNEANRISYQLQTRVPDVWAEKPTQEISIKMDFRR